jgi:hypothetical protein
VVQRTFSAMKLAKQTLVKLAILLASKITWLDNWKNVVLHNYALMM